MEKKRREDREKENGQYDKLRDKGVDKEKAERIARSPLYGKEMSDIKMYEERSQEELLQQAEKAGIEGRSTMSKEQLIEALRNR